MKKKPANFSLIFFNRSNYLKLLLALGLFFNKLNAQNVTVTGALNGNGTYPTFHAAISAINASVQTGATITVSVMYSDATSFPATLNAGTWASLSIIPSGGVSRVLSCPYNTGALLTLNGADNVLINGLNTGGNALTLKHIVASDNSCAIRLTGISLNNTITNCAVSNTNSGGSGTTGTLTGAICFNGTTTTAFQNTSISNCTISGTKGVFSDPGTNGIGVSTTPNIIQNCSFFYPSSGGSLYTAIDLQSNRYWLITGNHIYYPNLTNYGGTSRLYGIRLLGAYQHTITNNIIGYSNTSKTSPATMFANFYTGIEVSATNQNIFNYIYGNTITAMNYTPTNGGSSVTNEDGDFCGIRISGTGSFDIGTLSPNIIGGSTGTGSINSGGMLVGINSHATGSVTIHNNIIGALSSTVALGGVAGINVSSPPAFISLSGNMLGNPTANNMVSGLQSVNNQSTIVSGIYFDGTSGFNPLGNASINSNTIQNLSSFGTSTNSYVQGICFTGGVGPSSSTITSNIITNLTSASAMDLVGFPTVVKSGASAINIIAGTTAIQSNTITNISLTGTTNASSQAVGIYKTTGGSVSKNIIYNITNAATSTSNTDPSVAAGIVIGPGGTGSLTISNNFISLGSGSPNNTCFLGIQLYNCPNQYIYHNTINIEGTVSSGAMRSFGFYRGDFGLNSATQSIIDFRNNLITNSRTGGTGSHYAISNNYGVTPSSVGWGSNASNYNVLNANPATIGFWGGNRTLASWQSVSNCDATSYSNITVNYVNSANNLHLNMGLISTPIESGAQAVPSVITDIDNQNRPGPLGSTNGGALTSDIGADEFDGVLPDITPPVITYTTLPTICGVADRTLTATLTDFSGVPTSGILQPRIYFRKNVAAYTSSTGSLIAGTSTNGTWNFVISMSAIGGVNNGDLISYYLIAQDEYTNSINIGSNPALDLVAVNVNSVTTNPTIASQTFVINFTPTVSVNSGSICAGNTFVIVPSGASSYTYSSGSATVNPNLTTTYSITGTSSVGCVSGNTALATISVAPLPTLSVNSGSFCFGSPFVIVPTGASTYTISGGTATVSPANTSSYSVSGTSSVGCLSSNTVIATASMVPLPTLSVNSGSICSGGSFVIVPTGALTYTFSGGSATVSPLVTNSYSISGTSSLGCVSASVAISTVSVSPSPTLTVNSGSICSGNAFVLIPSGASTYTYSSGSSTVTPNTTTSYSITGTSSAGCVSNNTAICIVSVSPSPTLSVNSGSICSGNSFVIIPSGADTYTISGGTLTVNPNTTTSYSITGTSSAGCLSSNTAVSTITVNSLPTLSVQSTNTLMCEGETVTITVSGATSYSWNGGSTLNLIIVSPTLTTSYSVTGIDIIGCSKTEIVTQNVSPCSGIESLTFNSHSLISIFPNPNNGEFIINTPSETDITITNAFGRRIFQKHLEGGKNKLDLNEQAKGIYFVQERQNKISFKLIIE